MSIFEGMENIHPHIDIDSDFIEKALEKYRFHIEKVFHHNANAAFYKDILEKAGVLITEQKPDFIINDNKGNIALIDIKNNSSKSHLTRNYTFVDWVEDLLKIDNKPRLTQEIRDEYIRQFGKEIEFKNFSSKLATRAERTGRIKNRGYNELPLHRRYWWGLKDWFTAAGDFKAEYKNKIPDLQGNK